MAESSIFWTTNGTGDGATNYTQDDLTTVFMRLFSMNNAAEGVIQSWENELEVSGTSTNVTIKTGAGMVYGLPYKNTSNVTVAIPTPSISPRYDRIVLRANYTAQTVRITRIAGSEGGSAPSLTQSAGATWDVPLATAYITTGGVITVTDNRVFCRYGGGLIQNRFGSDFYGYALSTTIGTTASGVSLADMRRVNAPGMVVGAVSETFTAAASGTFTVLMGGDFADSPIVLLTLGSATEPVVLSVLDSSVTSSTFDLVWETTSGSTITALKFNWMAIGPVA